MQDKDKDKIAKAFGIRLRNGWGRAEEIGHLFERMRETRKPDGTLTYSLEIRDEAAANEQARGIIGEVLAVGSHASRHKLDRVFDKMYCWYHGDEAPESSADNLLAEYVQRKGHWDGHYPDWWQRVQRWHRASRG